MMLSGQEYVDEYASKVKAEQAETEKAEPERAKEEEPAQT
jgi:hypothetical protein